MSYSVCKIKNITGSAQTLHLHEFAIDEVYTIPDSERESWYVDAVLEAIINEDFEIHNSDGLVSSSKSDQIKYLEGNTISASVNSQPPFASKTLSDGTKLFRRKHGFSITIPANSNVEEKFNIPYTACKITKAEVINSLHGDKVDFKVYDNEDGDISGYPDVMLNQFGFGVYMSNEMYEDESQYDADLIAGMQIGVTYYNNSDSERTVYINLTLHELT